MTTVDGARGLPTVRRWILACVLGGRGFAVAVGAAWRGSRIRAGHLRRGRRSRKPTP